MISSIYEMRQDCFWSQQAVSFSCGFLVTQSCSVDTLLLLNNAHRLIVEYLKQATTLLTLCRWQGVISEEGVVVKGHMINNHIMTWSFITSKFHFWNDFHLSELTLWLIHMIRGTYLHRIVSQQCQCFQHYELTTHMATKNGWCRSVCIINVGSNDPID